MFPGCLKIEFYREVSEQFLSLIVTNKQGTYTFSKSKQHEELF